LIVNKGFEIKASGAGSRVEFFELLGKFVAAASIDCHFETGDALQPPLDIGKRLDQFALAQADRLEFVLISGEEVPVGFGVIGWQQDSAASQTSLDSVHRRDGLAGGG